MKIVVIAICCLSLGTACGSDNPQSSEVASLKIIDRTASYEGAVWHVRAVRNAPSGTPAAVVFDGRLLGTLDLGISLPPGRYQLSTFHRSCDGTCTHLNEPTPACRAALYLKAGGVLNAEVEQRAQGKCAISLTRPK